MFGYFHVLCVIHTVIMYASLKKEVNHLSSTLRALWGPYIYFVCESYLLERWCFHFTFTFIKKPTCHTLLYGTPSRDPVTVSMSKMWMSGMSLFCLYCRSYHVCIHSDHVNFQGLRATSSDLNNKKVFGWPHFYAKSFWPRIALHF